MWSQKTGSQTEATKCHKWVDESDCKWPPRLLVTLCYLWLHTAAFVWTRWSLLFPVSGSKLNFFFKTFLLQILYLSRHFPHSDTSSSTRPPHRVFCHSCKIHLSLFLKSALKYKCRTRAKWLSSVDYLKSSKACDWIRAVMWWVNICSCSCYNTDVTKNEEMLND